MSTKQNYTLTILIIVFIGLLGSITRFFYGYFHEPWNLAPDHLAWEIVVQNGKFTYTELIHYPHEGGTIVLTLVAKMIAFFTSFNALAITAFCFDFLNRCIQMWVVKDVFGKSTSIAFGVFTIFAYPLIIPWASVNFGLHAISAVFPFVFIYLMYHWNNSIRYQLLVGLFVGLSIWFSYSNFIFIPILMVYGWKNRENIERMKPLILSLTGVMLMSLVIRYTMDSGFQLAQFSMNSIRGVEIDLWSFSTLKNLVLVGNTLADGAMVSPSTTIQMLGKYLFIGFSVLAILSWIKLYRTVGLQPIHKLVVGIIALFLVIYGISPFSISEASSNYVLYRHLTYIFPLFVLFVLIGLQKTRHPILYSFFFISTGIIGSILLIEPDIDAHHLSANQPAGWVIGNKFGHSPQKVVELIAPIKDNKSLVIGIGWGMTTALFQNTKSSQPETEIKTQRLVDLIHEFPPIYHKDLIEGIEIAFGPDVSPQLDYEIQSRLMESLLTE